MKTPKTYRFSYFTLKCIEELRDYWPDCTDTEIVEHSIHFMRDMMANDSITKHKKNGE